MRGEVIIAGLGGKKKVKNRTGRERIEGQKNELEDESGEGKNGTSARVSE